MDKLPTDFSTQTVSTDFSTQTISSDGSRPQIVQTESSYVKRNKRFIYELNETILSSNKLLKKDISKHKKNINLNKIKTSMEKFIDQLNNEIDKIEDNGYTIDVLLKENLKKINVNLKKLNKMYSNIVSQ
jgi:hypothetical protein